MASSGLDVLAQLTSLLKEFYATTDNSRKKEIERVLTQFSHERDVWKQCLFFISNTTDEFVVMFCLNVLENYVGHDGCGRLAENRHSIRCTIYELLVTRHMNMSPFIRNKMSKLIVYIARQDWPYNYNNFFTDIYALIRREDTTMLGLVLLNTASEELACPRDDFVAARKHELLRLMLLEVPAIFAVLNDVLDAVLRRPLVVVAVTTASSSPHCPTGVLRNSSSESVSREPMSQQSTSSSVHQRLTLDTDVSSLAVQSLHCLCHVFSWTPLDTAATQAPPSLLSKLFELVNCGCHAGSAAEMVLGEAAMCCVNELLTKNQVPTAQCQQFVLALFTHTFSLLRSLTQLHHSNELRQQIAVTVRFDQLTNTYVDKLTEFLRLFVSVHLPRIEHNSQFPVIEFLAVLFKYTFQQVTNEGFYNCLHIWSEFLDYLQDQMESRGSDKQSSLTKYKDALVSLATELLHKLLFRYNQSQLEELDDDDVDDDCRTEWQKFLHECLEMMAKISQLYPHVVFSLLLTSFHSNMDVYMGLEQYIELTATSSDGGSRSVDECTGRVLRITAEHDCRRLHCALRDLSSLLQALGRLADHFIGQDKFTAAFNDAYLLVDRLLSTAVYSTRLRLYETRCAVEDVLRSDFTQVHAESLAAVKAYMTWLSQFYSQSHTSSSSSSSSADTQEQMSPVIDHTLTQAHTAAVNSIESTSPQQRCRAMIDSSLQATVPLFTSQRPVPDKILVSAGQLLLSLLTTVRPAQLYNSTLLQRLYADGVTVPRCPTQVELLVLRSLSHYLLLPWSASPLDTQDWEQRSARLTLLLQRTLHDYVMLSHQLISTHHLHHQAPPAQILLSGKACVHRAVSVITDIVDSLGSEGVSRSKQLCYACLSGYIDSASQLIAVYIQHSDVVDDLLGFFLAVFRCLRVQMGVTAAEKLVHLFISLFTREQIQETLRQDNVSGHQLVDKFLKILQVIVLEPTASFRTFLPTILNICLYHVCPVLTQCSSSDVKLTVYELLFQFLQYNWRYFFHSSVALVNSASTQHHQQVDNRPQFVAIIQAFGESFLQADIAVFRQNLHALESLNALHRLYAKEVMRSESLLAQLLSVLLQVLVRRSHGLLHDEMLTAVYNMAAVDFQSFYSEFLRHFLQSLHVTDSQQTAALLAHFHAAEQDQPSFTRNMNQFVNDLTYYQTCSASVHSAS